MGILFLAMNTTDFIDDASLVAAFEKAELPAEAWDHRAHVRVAFVYASLLDLHTALAQMQMGLRALNAAHRVPDSVDRRYHETITVAFMRLIDAATKKETFASSTEFCRRHPELLTKDALLRYYSHERLFSKEAKSGFVEPDLAPL
jgi:hypothetical protein